MDALEFPEWQQDYQALVLEADEQKFAERFKSAQDAIVLRMKNMKITSDTRLEALELEGALRALVVLKHEKFNPKRSQQLDPTPAHSESQAD